MDSVHRLTPLDGYFHFRKNFYCYQWLFFYFPLFWQKHFYFFFFADCTYAIGRSTTTLILDCPKFGLPYSSNFEGVEFWRHMAAKILIIIFFPSAWSHFHCIKFVKVWYFNLFYVRFLKAVFIHSFSFRSKSYFEKLFFALWKVSLTSK